MRHGISSLKGPKKMPDQPHIVDCDNDPSLKPGQEIVSHLRHGQIELNPSSIYLYVSPKEWEGYPNIREILPELEALKDKYIVLNANACDDLREHSQRIPKSWRGKHIYFCGTLLLWGADETEVRFLHWDEETQTWEDDEAGIDYVFDEDYGIALLPLHN